MSHPLFQELVSGAHIALETFRSKHPDYKFPTSAFLVAGLDARVRDFINPKKNGSSAASLRPEKIKKNKTSVCFEFSILLFSF